MDPLPVPLLLRMLLSLCVLSCAASTAAAMEIAPRPTAMSCVARATIWVCSFVLCVVLCVKTVNMELRYKGGEAGGGGGG